MHPPIHHFARPPTADVSPHPLSSRFRLQSPYPIPIALIALPVQTHPASPLSSRVPHLAPALLYSPATLPSIALLALPSPLSSRLLTLLPLLYGLDLVSKFLSSIHSTVGMFISNGRTCISCHLI